MTSRALLVLAFVFVCVNGGHDMLFSRTMRSNSRRDRGGGGSRGGGGGQVGVGGGGQEGGAGEKRRGLVGMELVNRYTHAHKHPNDRGNRKPNFPVEITSIDRFLPESPSPIIDHISHKLKHHRSANVNLVNGNDHHQEPYESNSPSVSLSILLGIYKGKKRVLESVSSSQVESQTTKAGLHFPEWKSDGRKIESEMDHARQSRVDDAVNKNYKIQPRSRVGQFSLRNSPRFLDRFHDKFNKHNAIPDWTLSTPESINGFPDKLNKHNAIPELTLSTPESINGFPDKLNKHSAIPEWTQSTPESIYGLPDRLNNHNAIPDWTQSTPESINGFPDKLNKHNAIPELTQSTPESINGLHDRLSNHNAIPDWTQSTPESINGFPDKLNKHNPIAVNSSHNRDGFKCGRCRCSYANHRFVEANCSSRNLFDFPQQDLPMKTFRMNILHNRLKSLNQSRVTDFKFIQTLSFRYNKITTMLLTESKSPLKQLDLSYNLLKTLEAGSFRFVPSLQNLTLSNNQIAQIGDETFLFLTKLHILDLSTNYITHISVSAFDSLVELRKLYLYRNLHLGYYVEHFPPGLFSNLTKLQVLYIQGCKYDSTRYPMEALGRLKSLEELNIDIVNAEDFLGPQMLIHTCLKTIGFGPHSSCLNRKIIPPKFFRYVPYVQSLSFHGCFFHQFDPKAYTYIPKLTKLSFVKLKTYSLNQAFEDIEGLENNMTPLRYLRFQALTGENKACYSLTGRHATFLKSLPLEELDLSDNNIALIQNDFIEGLPPTLKKWVLAGNVLTLKGQMWNRIHSLTNLVELDVSNQDYYPEYWTVTEDVDAISTQDFSEVKGKPMNSLTSNYALHVLPKGKDNSTNNTQISGVQMPDKTQLRATGMSYLIPNEDNTSPLPIKRGALPITLRQVKASHYSFFGEYFFLRFLKEHKVSSIDFSNSLLSRWGEGAMPLSVMYADLSYNYCRHLSITFFRPNNSLIQIYLQSNFLGSNFAIFDGRKYFTHLGQARYLDLSMNSIYRLPEYFLKGLSSLITLRITDNRLQDFKVSLAETPLLSFLDLRRNSICWLSKYARQDMDQLALQHPVTLALLHNPISCTCETLDMIKWMAMTKVYLLDKELLECRDENGNIRVMGDIRLLHDTLHRRCTDRYNIIISSTICVSLFVLIVVGCYVGKRYRWWFYVKYKTNVWIAKWFGFKPKLQEKQSRKFQYDAYVCYSEEDRDLAVECANKLKSHRLFIPDRDILFGTSEVGGMTSGIINSHKFVIFLTENFKEDLRTGFSDNSMLEYTINMALFEEVSTKRKFLHLMQFADTDDVQIPLYLASVLQDHDRRTTFPIEDPYSTPEAIQCTWDSLSTCIGQGDAIS